MHLHSQVMTIKIELAGQDEDYLKTYTKSRQNFLRTVFSLILIMHQKLSKTL